MNISKAIELLQIEDIFNESDDTLKSKYRVLMKKYHPDSVNGDAEKSKEIIDAYSMLKVELPKILRAKVVNTASSNTNINIGVDFSKIIEIYSGKEIKINNNIVLDSKKVLLYNVLAFINVSITHNDTERTFTNTEVVNVNREYSIWCNIDVTDLNNNEEIILEAYNKKYTLNLKSQSNKIIVKLDNDIKLQVYIDKRIFK